MDPSYFKINTDGSPMHLILLDEIAQTHTLLHDRILSLLTKLFQTTFTDLDNLVQVKNRNKLELELNRFYYFKF